MVKVKLKHIYTDLLCTQNFAVTIPSSSGEPQYAIRPVGVTRKQHGSYLILLEISLLTLPSKNSGYPVYLSATCFIARSS